MVSREREREVLTGPLTAEHLAARSNAGWHPVAVEWERTVGEVRRSGGVEIEVPYGLEVTPSGSHLRESAAEVTVLRRMLTQIVDDRSLSEIAETLNREGSSRRDGSPWTPSALFELLPRVIEVAPSIYASPEWQEERDARQKAG